MSKVITFSQNFPYYHLRAGEKTFFVEKMIEWYWDNDLAATKFHNVEDMIYTVNKNKLDTGLITKSQIDDFLMSLDPEVQEWKQHTIRGGHRFKDGDVFKPCVWLGKPYYSRQIQFLPELKIPKTFDFEIKKNIKELPLDYESMMVINHSYHNPDSQMVEKLSHRDGLSKKDLLRWFQYPKLFSGQIICFDKSIQY